MGESKARNFSTSLLVSKNDSAGIQRWPSDRLALKRKMTGFYEDVRIKENPGFSIGRISKTWIFRPNADNLNEGVRIKPKNLSF